MNSRLNATIVAAALLGCSGDSGPSEPADSENTGPTVAVRNNLFDPNALEVPVNGTVTWEWNSAGVEHNVTFPTGASSATQSSGSFARSFESAGSFPYLCTIHSAEGMSGVVTVTSGAGQTGGGGGGGAGGGDTGGGGDDGGGGGGYP